MFAFNERKWIWSASYNRNGKSSCAFYSCAAKRKTMPYTVILFIRSHWKGCAFRVDSILSILWRVLKCFQFLVLLSDMNPVWSWWRVTDTHCVRHKWLQAWANSMSTGKYQNWSHFELQTRRRCRRAKEFLCLKFATRDVPIFYK